MQQLLLLREIVRGSAPQACLAREERNQEINNGRHYQDLRMGQFSHLQQLQRFVLHPLVLTVAGSTHLDQQVVKLFEH